MTTSEEIEGWGAGLDALHARIAGRFHGSQARDRAKRYLGGEQILCPRGAITPVASGELFGEYARVLRHSRLVRLHGMTAEQITSELAAFAGFAEVVVPGSVPTAVVEDPANDMVLATARLGSAEYIVSGDQHLLRLGSYYSIQMLPTCAPFPI